MVGAQCADAGAMKLYQLLEKMMTKDELATNVKTAVAALAAATKALADFDDLPENNRFDTLEIAEATIQDALDELAYQDCQGAHNVGKESYSRECLVGDDKYRITANYEYNRHDKTYYYVDEYSYKTEKL